MITFESPDGPILTGISQCYLTIMKISGHAARSAWISSGTVVLNLILNAVFIFGFAGIPALGARGAAIATLIGSGSRAWMGGYLFL